MTNESFLVFQPNGRSKSTKPTNPKDFLERVLACFPREFRGQFQLFPYVFADTRRGWSYTGFIYRREQYDDEDPLSYVAGADLIETVNKLASELGAEATAEFFKGQVEIASPTQEQYERILSLCFNSQHSDLRLKPPTEVKRFLLNLDNRTFERVTMPYLDTVGYKRIEVRKIS